MLFDLNVRYWIPIFTLEKILIELQKKKAEVRFHIFRMFEFLKLFRNYGIIVKKKKEEKKKGTNRRLKSNKK